MYSLLRRSHQYSSEQVEKIHVAFKVNVRQNSIAKCQQIVISDTAEDKVRWKYR